MKRKIYEQLLKWKQEDAGQTALLIDGARRVGKSYIVEAFAKAEYKNYILIDFNRVTRDVTDLFVNYLNDLDTFFMYLSGYYNVKLYERQIQDKYKEQLHVLYVLHASDLKEENGITFLPLYMTPLL